MTSLHQFTIVVVVMLLCSFAHASTVTSLVGDKDGFGIGLAPGDTRPTAGPPQSVFFDGRGPTDPLFTDVYPIIPITFSYTHSFALSGAMIVSANLSLLTLAIQDGDTQVVGSDTDIRMFLDGSEVPGAFDTVDQFFFDLTTSQFVESAGVVTIPVPSSSLALLADGSVEVGIQILQLGSAQITDAIAIDYSELTVEANLQAVPEPSTALLVVTALAILAVAKYRTRRQT